MTINGRDIAPRVDGALRALTFPEAAIRDRARRGAASVFPSVTGYGRTLFGAGSSTGQADPLDGAQLVPPVFVPGRLHRLIELGREPLYSDVDLATVIGGLASPLPLYVSAFGSTRAASVDAGMAASRQAGRLGIPLVIGENVVPVNGYRHLATDGATLIARLRGYTEAAPAGAGGVVVQSSTEDADAEVWNLVYSDPAAQFLLEAGRLAFELKVGQGAKPGLGGMTVLDGEAADRLADRYALDQVLDTGAVLRSGSPGTFTAEILRQQIRLMRNNYPRVRVWVKLHPGRDVGDAARVAWSAGADAVTVDGAEGGTGWAPQVFLDHVGLPLGECLLRIGRPTGCLLASARVWEGARAAKCLALGATAVGLGRAALIAVDTDHECGLLRLAESIALELRLLSSALGKYTIGTLDSEDVWFPPSSAHRSWS